MEMTLSINDAQSMIAEMRNEEYRGNEEYRDHMTEKESAEESTNLVSRKRRMLKKAPDAPKRFKSAYICFVMEKMDELKQQLPADLKVGHRSYSCNLFI